MNNELISQIYSWVFIGILTLLIIAGLIITFIWELKEKDKKANYLNKQTKEDRHIITDYLNQKLTLKEFLNVKKKNSRDQLPNENTKRSE